GRSPIAPHPAITTVTARPTSASSGRRKATGIVSTAATAALQPSPLAPTATKQSKAITCHSNRSAPPAKVGGCFSTHELRPRALRGLFLLCTSPHVSKGGTRNAIFTRNADLNVPPLLRAGLCITD